MIGNISVGTIQLLYWSTASNETWTQPTTLYDSAYDFTLYDVPDPIQQKYVTKLMTAHFHLSTWYIMLLPLTILVKEIVEQQLDLPVCCPHQFHVLRGEIAHRQRRVRTESN